MGNVKEISNEIKLFNAKLIIKVIKMWSSTLPDCQLLLVDFCCGGTKTLSVTIK